LALGLRVFLALAILIGSIAVGLIAHRIAKIRGGARGTAAYVDFSGFNLSGIQFADGNQPDKEAVKKTVLKLMNQKFEDAGVHVYELPPEHKTILTTPILSFTQENGVIEGDHGIEEIEWGSNIVGGTTPEILLGNFRLDLFNGRFSNNDDLARAIAFLGCHEVGHSYKLLHLDESDNIMRSRIVLPGEGTGLGGKVTPDDVIKGLLRDCSFTENQIGVISNVALTGKKT